MKSGTELWLIAALALVAAVDSSFTAAARAGVNLVPAIKIRLDRDEGKLRGSVEIDWPKRISADWYHR